MSTVKANNYYDTSGGSNAQLYGVASPPNSMGFRNRVINGDCRIDQRNAGASITANDGTYPIDRFVNPTSQSSKLTAQRNAGSVTPPAGFTNYLGYTSSSAYSVGASDYFTCQQNIEGFNVADLAWGTASAQPITISFWVRSSLTGTFGGSLRNSAADRSYPFTYTISAANTWEQKTVNIAGDTSGTWGTGNGVGISMGFGLGVGSTLSGTAGAWAGANYRSATGATSVVGTNGATWYITGVQFEAGTVASPFERRDYGRELMMCQRYYYRSKAGFQYGALAPSGRAQTGSQSVNSMPFPVQMRTAPTSVETSGTATDYAIAYVVSAVACSAVPTFAGSTSNIMGYVNAYLTSGMTAGQSVDLLVNSANGYLGWSAEL